MSMSDPIADMLTRIRNGQQARKVSVSMPAAKLKSSVAQVLQDEGYVAGFNTEVVDGKPTLTVTVLRCQCHPRSSRRAGHCRDIHLSWCDDRQASQRPGFRWRNHLHRQLIGDPENIKCHA